MGIRYVESALRDAQREGLVSIEDARAGAKRVYATVPGMLLFARIHNSLAVLQELEPTIMDMIGAKELVA